MRISLKHKIKAHLVACALAGATFSGSALGAIVYSGPVSIPIPDTVDGIYLNVVTGVSNPSAGSVPGWDLNPYSNVAGQFNLWGPTVNTWFTPDAVVGGNYVLAPGTLIQGAASAFFRPGLGTNIGTQVTLNSNQNYLGFRFQNEAAANQIQFGWIQVEFGATAATRSIVAYAYEDTGVAIAAGDTGVPAPEAILGFDLGALNFGNVELGNSSAAQTVTLSNIGDADGDVTALETDTADFAITGGTCDPAPFTLGAGDDCTVMVTYTPSAAGPASGQLAFSTDPLRGGPITSVALSGMGTEPPGSPSIGFNVANLNFGNVDIGDVSTSQTATLTNYGDATGTVSSLNIDNAVFAITGGDCGSTPFDLAEAESCTLDLTFSPTMEGLATGELTFSMPLRGLIMSVDLSGNGIDPTFPEISFTSSSVTFGNTVIGSNSAPQMVTVTNYGTAIGTVSALDINTMEFAISGGTCPATPFTLAPGATCTVAVIFSPTFAGPTTGQLYFGGGGKLRGGPILSVLLSGVGIAGTPAPIATMVPVNSPWALIALLGMFGLVASVTLRRR